MSRSCSATVAGGGRDARGRVLGILDEHADGSSPWVHRRVFRLRMSAEGFDRARAEAALVYLSLSGRLVERADRYADPDDVPDQPPGGRPCERPAGRRGRSHCQPWERASDARERKRARCGGGVESSPSSGWREVATAMHAVGGQRHE